MEITRGRKSGLIFLSQHDYINKVLHRCNMPDAKKVTKPIAPHFKLLSTQCPVTDEDIEYMSRAPYFSVVGSLMYVMVCSCPNFSYAEFGGRYMANPGKEHWKVVQWISDIFVALPKLV
jgi:hypothetical protein